MPPGFWPFVVLERGQRLSSEQIRASIEAIRAGRRLTLIGEGSDGTRVQIEVTYDPRASLFRCIESIQPADCQSPAGNHVVTVAAARFEEILTAFPDPPF